MSKHNLALTAALLLFLIGLGIEVAGRSDRQPPGPVRLTAAIQPAPGSADETGFTVDLTPLLPRLAEVPVEERGNQIADWAVLALLAHGGADAATLRTASYDLAPLRLPELSRIVPFDYGSGRRIPVSDDEVWLLYSAFDPHPKVTLARLADRVAMEHGGLPSRLVGYRYRSDLSRGELRIEREGSLPAERLLSADYGYIERRITSAAELGEWLDTADDLRDIRMAPDGALVISGRRFAESRTPNLTLEDVAALYQAHKELEERERRAGEEIVAPSRRLINLFNAAVEAAKQGRAQAFADNVAQLEAALAEAEAQPDGSARNLFSFLNWTAALAKLDELQQRVRVRRDELERKQQAKMLLEGRFPPPEPGFSLDPLWNPDGLVTDLRRLVQDPDKLVEEVEAELDAAPKPDPLAQRRFDRTARDLLQAFHESRSGDHPARLAEAPEYAELKSLLGKVSGQSGKKLEDGIIVPFLKLKERLGQAANDAVSGDASSRARERAARDLLLAFLEHIETRNRSQCARYDGPLQGTAVGMNLFYTDLVAKLWAGINYYGSAPTRQVPGFLTMPDSNFALEPAFWAEYWRLPNTRLWFGTKPEAFRTNDDRSLIAFEHIATRVYAAGSNPLLPGKEESASEDSQRVFNWWNRHYGEVADYEPQYHVQNEIMKWSVVTGWLARQGALADLAQVPVDRTKRFDRWLAANDALRFRGDPRFLPDEAWRGGTECLEILSSYIFPAAGQPSTYVEGGVSLGSARSLDDVVRTEGRVPLALERGALRETSTAGDDLALVNGTRVKLEAADAKRASLHIAPKDDRPIAAGAVEMQPGAFRVSYERAGQGFHLSWESEAADLHLGTLVANATPDGVRLSWNAGRLEEAHLTTDRMREAVLSVGPFGNADDLALKIASGHGLLPSTGHYVLVLDGEPLQVLAGGGGGGRIGLPPAIRGPPGMPDSEPFRFRLVAGKDRQTAGEESVLHTVASDSKPNALWWSPRTYAIDATPITEESAQDLLAKAAWQRLWPLDPADSRPGHVARLFTNSGPPAEARRVTIRTSDAGSGSLEGYWHDGSLYLERPDDRGLHAAFNNVVELEAITSADLVHLSGTLAAGAEQAAITLGRLAGAPFGWEALSAFAEGDYTGAAYHLLKAAKEGKLEGAADAFRAEADLAVVRGLLENQQTEVTTRLRLVLMASDTTRPPELGSMLVAISRGDPIAVQAAIDDTARAHHLGALTADQAEALLREAGGDDVVRVIERRLAAGGEPALRMGLSARGKRLVTSSEIDLLKQAHFVGEQQRQLLPAFLRDEPQAQVYIADSDFLARFDFDSAPEASLAQLLKVPQLNVAILTTPDPSLSPSMLVAPGKSWHQVDQAVHGSHTWSDFASMGSANGEPPDECDLTPDLCPDEMSPGRTVIITPPATAGQYPAVLIALPCDKRMLTWSDARRQVCDSLEPVGAP